MKRMSSLGLHIQIGLPLALMALAIAITCALGVHGIRTLIANAEHSSERLLPAISLALNGDRDLYQALVAQMAYVNTRADGRDASGHQDSFNENSDQALERLQLAADRLDSPQSQQLMRGFESAFEQWFGTARKTMTLADQGQIREAQTLLRTTSSQQFDTLRNYYDEVGLLADEQASATTTAAIAQGNANNTLALMVTAVALLISGGLSVLFARSILVAVRRLRHRFDDIAEGKGDLTRRIPVERQDDLGKLAVSFNQVLDNLQSMVRSIKELAEQLGQDAQHLSGQVSDNDSSVGQQTDAINQVATAINQLHSAIQEVAGNAAHATEATREAKASGDEGANQVRASSDQVQRLVSQIGNAVEVIQRLAKDSDNISSVLDVIRGIAEQTNLLALNAAIEAARAGEQGRGFAVVADEVRTLAGRTQSSTEDIQKMISTLQSGVAEVVEVMETSSQQAADTETLASAAEAALSTNVQALERISDINLSVASATEQQTLVVDEINRNVTQVSELADAGAGRSREISQISQDVAQHAKNLSEEVRRFRI
ncbi:MAG: methyl-accepting chemotaxis protein [Pseudomonadales bacterium]|nr:methyl-accepting chemotaxis protein [Pseudomonadales bacterium]